MPARYVVACAALAIPLAACSGSSAPDLGSDGQIAAVGQRVPAPDLAQTPVGGGSFSLAALKGHVVVINVFGSWCPPCNAEQPDLTSLANDEKSSGVEFVGLAERDNPSKLAAYLAKYAVPYPALEDDSGSLVARFRTLPVSAVPATLILDKQGREAARFIAGVLPSQLKPVIATLQQEPA